MINAHEFQQAAKKFRAGRVTLKEFTDLVFDGKPTSKPNEENPTTTAQDENVEQVVVAAEVVKTHELDGGGLAQLAKRPADSHKGDFGRVLAIGGSEGMAGAISLTGLAALKSGSGLVKVAVPEMIQAMVAAFNPCLMTIGCMAQGDSFHGGAEDALSHHAEWADVIAVGPGMGRGDAQQWILKKLYTEIQQPMVVDADGLNALADANCDLSNHAGQRVLTPHPGEFQRIAITTITNRIELEAAAKTLAKSSNSVVVLKGNKTLVTDGEKEYRNNSGNPGMATAGSGDVLTGIITSFVGQGLPVFDAAATAVYVHGLAGDFAAEKVGETSLIATDLIDSLPAALKSHAASALTRIGF